jgi:hypothetical protein
MGSDNPKPAWGGETRSSWGCRWHWLPVQATADQLGGQPAGCCLGSVWARLTNEEGIPGTCCGCASGGPLQLEASWTRGKWLLHFKITRVKSQSWKYRCKITIKFLNGGKNTIFPSILCHYMPEAKQLVQLSHYASYLWSWFLVYETFYMLAIFDRDFLCIETFYMPAIFNRDFLCMKHFVDLV